MKYTEERGLGLIGAGTVQYGEYGYLRTEGAPKLDIKGGGG